jgi:hypothetical protein
LEFRAPETPMPENLPCLEPGVIVTPCCPKTVALDPEPPI